MLLIPAMVSVLILAVSLLFFVNVVYKQVMDETVREENTVHYLLIRIYIRPLRNMSEHRKSNCKFIRAMHKFVPWEQVHKHLPANRYRSYPVAHQTVAFIWNRQK